MWPFGIKRLIAHGTDAVVTNTMVGEDLAINMNARKISQALKQEQSVLTGILSIQVDRSLAE